MALSLDYHEQKPASGQPPKQVILLLHGYGSNGRDLISLAPYFAKTAPNALFISPDAPFPCEMGGGGFQWFSLAHYTPEALIKGTKEATPILQTFIDEILKKHNLEDENLILIGFSQGTMMSLYVGPRRKNKIAGILGYSGALIHENDLADVQKPPICLVHGEADDVVTINRYHDAVRDLKAAGFDVSGCAVPHLVHSIDEKGIMTGIEFIESCIETKL